MLKFKEFLQREELTVGKHNDYATGAIVPSVASGSETLSSRTPGLTSQDMIVQDLPKQTIVGKLWKVTFGTGGACTLHVWTQKGSTSYRVDYEQLKRMVPGFGDIDTLVRNKSVIKLTTQGYDPHGNLQVRWGTIE